MEVFIFLVLIIVIMAWLKNIHANSYNVPDKESLDLLKQQNEIKEQILNKISFDFNKSPWDMWDKSVHYTEGQYERLNRAVTESIEVLSYDRRSIQAYIKGASGKQYATSYTECSCPDFQFRQIPCKHMYFLCIWINDNE